MEKMAILPESLLTILILDHVLGNSYPGPVHEGTSQSKGVAYGRLHEGWDWGCLARQRFQPVIVQRARGTLLKCWLPLKGL